MAETTVSAAQDSRGFSGVLKDDEDEYSMKEIIFSKNDTVRRRNHTRICTYTFFRDKNIGT